MKQSKRGFTIVELVIVIAVIAVLAAVLIPTFSSLIKKANLSADMQAVREMNIELASYEALNGKPQDVDTVMSILSKAGFHTDNWKTLTAGYEVYWYKNDNRMVLYSTKENKLIYPEGYDASLFLDQRSDFWMYNQNTAEAEKADTSLNISSSKTGQNKTQMESSASTESEKAAIRSIDTAVTANSTIKSSLGIAEGQQVYFNGSKELVSEVAAGTSASMYITQVSDSTTPTLTSSGDIAANLIYISINTAANATATEILAAQKAASEYVYTAFVQINSAKFSEDVTIMLPAGTEINASAHEWKPVKHFSGYFGTTDAEHPIIINGASLSAATGYLDTVYFEGSGGKYFVTGFFGCVYGNATIENVLFRNMTMDQPGSNYDMTLTTKQHSRNSIGIIGGVIDDPAAGTAGKNSTNVIVRNITVENNVKIKSAATAAGIVGYVGASGDKDVVNSKEVYRRLFNGTLLIENCKVSAEIIGGPETGTYGPCGGIVGFICRAGEETTGFDEPTADGKKSNTPGECYNVIIKDCTFDGKVTGYQGVGAAVGDFQTSAWVIFQGRNDFSGATLRSVDPNGSNWCGMIGTANGDTWAMYVSTATEIKLADGMKVIGSKATATMTDKAYPGKTKYATVTDNSGHPIGGNNGLYA